MRSVSSGTQPPRLELVDITKRFGAFVANDKVSLKLEPGPLYALLGENGAGKSTLVKCIMGYHLADTFDRPPLAWKHWWLNKRQIRQNGRQWINRFNVKTRNETTPIANLSGGNVQRAVLARELGPGTAEVLVVANPCMGLDFGAVDFVARCRCMNTKDTNIS